MAIFYETNGSITILLPQIGHQFSYAELKGMVKGMVQIVPLPDGKSIIVNEEGKLIGLPVNEAATAEWKRQYPIEKYPLNNDELIVGNALIVDDKELGD